MEGEITVTVLGCGGSLGVPSLGYGWGDCDPAEPRNQRTRSSILISHKGFNLLVDSGPDVRQQLLREGVDHVDAVFYTHEHADHTHGIDDVRAFAMKARRSLPIYGDRKTMAEIDQRFGYLIAGRPEHAGETGRKVGLELNIVEPTGIVQIGPLEARTFQQSHGRGISLGLRIGSFAYSTDVSYLSRAALAVLDGVGTWIVDCNNRTPKDAIKHSDLANTLGWIERVGTSRAYLTHLPAWHDYQTLLSQCPDGVEPAYDGLKLRTT